MFLYNTKNDSESFGFNLCQIERSINNRIDEFLFLKLRTIEPMNMTRGFFLFQKCADVCDAMNVQKAINVQIKIKNKYFFMFMVKISNYKIKEKNAIRFVYSAAISSVHSHSLY